MKSSSIEILKSQLIRHEGLKLKPYRCPAGKLTIGVGHNLDDNGITRNVALHILENDISLVVEELHRYDWFTKLDDARKIVVANMVFNMGLPVFLEFKKMISAIEKNNFVKASSEMLSSKWAKQVGDRAIELANIMRTGVVQ